MPPTTVDPRFWDRIAEDYAAQPVGDPDAFDRKIAHTRALLSPDALVLEVGCGTGTLATRLAPDAGAIHGIDASGEMIRIAREKARDIDHVHFHQGTIDNTPLEDGSVDLLGAWSLLHLVPDRGDFLARAFALLRPGGVLVTSTTCLGDSMVPYRPVLALMRWLGKAPWVDVITTPQLVGELEAAGFVDLQEPDVGAAATIAFLIARKPG